MSGEAGKGAGPPGCPGRLVLVTGWSGAGKTTVGSFLELLVHGWQHLDGDNIMHRKDAQSQKLTKDLVTSFYSYWFKGLPAPPELWKPYLDELAKQCQQQRAEASKPLVLSFSVYRREAREYLRQLMPDLTILQLDCDPKVVVASALERLETYLGNKKMTVQDWWRENKKDETYGEARHYYLEYSLESYTQMQMAEYLSGLEDFGEDELGCLRCEVTSRGSRALDAVAEALQLPRQAVDLEQLKDLERKRLAELAASHGPA